jgi:hypothetical protein
VDGSTVRFLVLHYTSVEPSWLRLAMNPGTGFVNAEQFHRLPIKQLRTRGAQPGTCVTDVRIGVPVPAGH